MKAMRTQTAIVLIGTAALFTGSLRAQEPAYPTGTVTNTTTNTNTVTGTYTGTVRSVDSATGAFTVETSDGLITITSNPSTSYMSGGRKVMLTDLKAGDRVTISGATSGNSRLASQVTIGGVPSSSTMSTTPTTGTSSPMTVGSSPVTGRVTAIDRSGRIVTIQTVDGPVAYRVTDRNVYSVAGRDVLWTDLQVNDDVTLRAGTGTARTSGDSSTYDRTRELPHTAGLTPLLGFGSFALIGLSLLMRAARRFAV